MVEDNPNQKELEKMAVFCSKYNHIFLYGYDYTERMIAKYMKMASLTIDGYVSDNIESVNDELQIITFDKLKSDYKKSKVGIIVSSGKDEDVLQIKKYGFKHIFVVDEWNRRTIPYKMTPRSKENFWVEVNLADHCNLNCQSCDHFSPIAEPTFLDFDQYVKDLKRLSDLTDNKIGLIKLQGGEPLLNTKLIDYIRVTREIFPNAFICVFTAGLLLKKWGNDDNNNLWKAVKDYEIEIRWTHYPIPLKFDEIRKTVESYGIEWWETPPPFEKGARVWFFSEIGALQYKGEKHSVKHPFWTNGGVAPFRWISCYQFNESIVLRDGRIYTCPMIPYVHFFNDYFKCNLEVKEEDSIDIYKVESYEEIAEFCTRRVPFCSYCAVHHRYSRPWKQSEHTIEEWTENPPFFGDSINPILSVTGHELMLLKIGLTSLRDNGIKETWIRTKRVLLKKY